MHTADIVNSVQIEYLRSAMRFWLGTADSRIYFAMTFIKLFLPRRKTMPSARSALV